MNEKEEKRRLHFLGTYQPGFPIPVRKFLKRKWLSLFDKLCNELRTVLFSQRERAYVNSERYRTQLPRCPQPIIEERNGYADSSGPAADLESQLFNR
jgi:hypothetical protein